MDQLMLEREIIKVRSLEDIGFSNSYFLWVIHADKIPPHIGISFDDRFFSLKSNGKDEGLSIFRMESILRKKCIPVLFYEIEREAVQVTPGIIFSNYEKTVSGNVTCLEPLKDIFGVLNATWIKELLQSLKSKDFIRNCYGWQLPEGFTEIPDYSPAEIHQRLIALENAS